MSSRYEPLVLIARGGTCEIWLGLLEGAAGFRKPVVLKRAFAGAGGDLDHAQRALVAEAHVSAGLAHPNIIHVYELVDIPEGVMLAMEYLPGISVRGVMVRLEHSQGKVPWPIAARIGADAARGLEYAHEAASSTGQPLQIIHRDVSPENLVVTDQGITKVVDFGIARSTLRDSTTGFVIKGKLAYMSPEQVRGEPLDGRSDVFSLGIVLHEMLSGLRLFERGQPGKTIEAVLMGPIPTLPDSINVVVRDVVRRMLIREAESGRITMREAADALEAAATGHGGSHRDVQTFLRAEFAAPLEHRRARLKELLARPAALPVAQREEPDTGTVAAIELVLDEPSQEPTVTERPRGEGAEGDTIKEGGLKGTLIERPLLRRKPRKG